MTGSIGKKEETLSTFYEMKRFVLFTKHLLNI